MEPIYQATIRINSGNIFGSSTVHLGFYQSPKNAWSSIINYVKEDKFIKNSFISWIRKNNSLIEKDLYKYKLEDFLEDLSTGEISYACISNCDYYSTVEPIKIEDYSE